MKRYLVFSNGYYLDLKDRRVISSEGKFTGTIGPQAHRLLLLLLEHVNEYVGTEILWNELNKASAKGIEEGNRPVRRVIRRLKTAISDHANCIDIGFIQNSAVDKLNGYGWFMNNDVILSDEPVFVRTEEWPEAYQKAMPERKRIDAISDVAASDSSNGRNEEACRKREIVYQWRLEHLGEAHEDTVKAMANLATSYNKLGRYSEALPLRRQVLDFRRSHTCSPDDLRKARKNLAVTLNQIGGEENIREAEQLRNENLSMFGEDPTD